MSKNCTGTDLRNIRFQNILPHAMPARRPGRCRASALAACALMIAGLTLGACSAPGIFVSTGARAGVAASEERGFTGAVSDTRIRIAINDLWFKHDIKMYDRVGLQIYEGRVLLSGIVPDEAERDEAVRLSWQPKGVREVINEIQVGEGVGFNGFARDKLINNRLKAMLLFDQGIDSFNYSNRTVDGTVYILGVADSREELDRIYDLARGLGGVRKVVGHVLMVDDPRRFEDGDGPGPAVVFDKDRRPGEDPRNAGPDGRPLDRPFDPARDVPAGAGNDVASEPLVTEPLGDMPTQLGPGATGGG